MRFMGWGPEMIKTDPEYQAEYAAWLKVHENDPQG